MVNSLPICGASVNVSGDILFEDYKGVEDPLRKHHTSSVTRDIWLLKNGAFSRLSSYVGENRNPVFASDGDSFYFLRENVQDNPYDADACFNVWKSSISSPEIQEQITFMQMHPVRDLSVSSGGLLLFSWNGDLYTCHEGQPTEKVKITLHSDVAGPEVRYTNLGLGIRAMAVSPNGKEVAIVCRGEVYVSSTEIKSTRRVTNTPVQERGSLLLS